MKEKLFALILGTVFCASSVCASGQDWFLFYQGTSAGLAKQ